MIDNIPLFGILKYQQLPHQVDSVGRRPTITLLHLPLTCFFNFCYKLYSRCDAFLFVRISSAVLVLGTAYCWRHLHRAANCRTSHRNSSSETCVTSRTTAAGDIWRTIYATVSGWARACVPQALLGRDSASAVHCSRQPSRHLVPASHLEIKYFGPYNGTLTLDHAADPPGCVSLFADSTLHTSVECVEDRTAVNSLCYQADCSSSIRDESYLTDEDPCESLPQSASDTPTTDNHRRFAPPFRPSAHADPHNAPSSGVSHPLSECDTPPIDGANGRAQKPPAVSAQCVSQSFGATQKAVACDGSGSTDCGPLLASDEWRDVSCGARRHSGVDMLRSYEDMPSLEWDHTGIQQYPEVDRIDISDYSLTGTPVEARLLYSPDTNSDSAIDTSSLVSSAVNVSVTQSEVVSRRRKHARSSNTLSRAQRDSAYFDDGLDTLASRQAVPSVGENMNLLDYALQQWGGGTTESSQIILQGYMCMRDCYALTTLCHTRLDNYSALRSALAAYQLSRTAAAATDPETSLGALFSGRCAAELEESSWIGRWTFGSHLSYSEDICDGIRKCLDTLKRLLTNQDGYQMFRLWNSDLTLDTEAMEGLKLLLLYAVLRQYERNQQKQKADALRCSCSDPQSTSHAARVLACGSTSTPEEFMLARLNNVGDGERLNQNELGLLAEVLCSNIQLFRPRVFGQPDFHLSFCEPASRILSIVTEDDCYYGVVFS